MKFTGFIFFMALVALAFAVSSDRYLTNKPLLPSITAAIPQDAEHQLEMYAKKRAKEASREKW